MTPPSDPSLVERLLLQIVDRMEEIQDKLSEKIDHLDAKVDGRIGVLDHQVREHSEKIQKHEHYFGFLTWAFTGGIAVVASWGTWISNLFNQKGH